MTESSSGGGAAEADRNTELHRLQQECASMVTTLKALHDEEQELRESNAALAQRAMWMGCTAGLEATRRGAKRKAAAAAAAAAAKKASTAAAAATPKTAGDAPRPPATDKSV
ncbi:hypothetical protein ACHAXT_004390 [Thalassiosira profunda]